MFIKVIFFDGIKLFMGIHSQKFDWMGKRKINSYSEQVGHTHM